MEGSDHEMGNRDDWFHGSDIVNDIPDPNDDPQSLFQSWNKLPEKLTKKQFLEGLIYPVTVAKDKHVTLLGLLIEKKEETFLLRVYYTKGATRKSFHTGAEDKELSYDGI